MLTYADVHRKKAEETKNELDLSSLVQAAALKEKELKEADIASKQQRQATEVSASNSRASAAAGAAEHAGAHAAVKEGRWWEQVETDARAIAAGEMQAGADTRIHTHIHTHTHAHTHTHTYIHNERQRIKA